MQETKLNNGYFNKMIEDKHIAALQECFQVGLQVVLRWRAKYNRNLSNMVC